MACSGVVLLSLAFCNQSSGKRRKQSKDTDCQQGLDRGFNLLACDGCNYISVFVIVLRLETGGRLVVPLQRLQRPDQDFRWHKDCGQPRSITYDGTVYYYLLNAQGDVVGLIDSTGVVVVQYTYDAWGRLLSTSGTAASTLGLNNPLRYRGYIYDTETGLYYLQSRYYNPTWGGFINADDPGYMGVDGTPSSYNLFAYCGNNPISNYDPTGCFLLSTAVLIGAMIGGAIGATAGGVIAYNIAKDSGAEGWELIGWTALGILGGGAVGAAAGAAIGYGVGYLAGGTYASGLPAKSVGNAVKTFVSQENKVHHVLGKVSHKLSGYTPKSMGKLMKRTLADGVVGSYKSVQSAVLAPIGSEVTFTIIGGAIKVSDMWIQ
jgi:RHS repeat-associated protein